MPKPSAKEARRDPTESSSRFGFARKYNLPRFFVICAGFCIGILVVAVVRKTSASFLYRPPPPAPESSQLLWRFGLWRLKNGDTDGSLTSLFQALDIHERRGSAATPLGVSILAAIVAASRKREKLLLADTLHAFQHLLDILSLPPPGPMRDELLGSLMDPVESLREIGISLQEPPAVEDEILVWKMAVNFCDVMGRLQTIKGADMLLRVGVSISKRPDATPDSILEWYHKSERIFELSNSTHSDRFALLVHNLGVVCSMRGDKKGELAHYERAVAIYESLGLVTRETYGGLLYELAAIREETGNVDGGREAVQKAQRVFEQSSNPWAKLRAFYSQTLGVSRLERGDIAGAIFALELAKLVHEKRGTLHSEGGTAVQMSLAEARRQLGKLPDVEQWRTLNQVKWMQRPAEGPKEGECSDDCYLQLR